MWRIIGVINQCITNTGKHVGKMNINKTILQCANIGILLIVGFGFSSFAFAELQLPKGERSPNLSLDPFERARKAVKQIPTQSAEEPARERAAPEKIQGGSDALAAETSSEGAADEPAEPFSYEILGIADFFTLVSGGPFDDGTSEEAPVTRAIPMMVDLAGEVDTEAAGLWKDGLIFAHLMLYSGSQGTPSAIVGDFHGLSNIDAGLTTTVPKLLELWYQHSFPFSKSSFLIGIHDWNSEFYIAEYAGLFLNGTFGMGSVIGIGSPSAYPTTTAGLRYKSQLTEDIYFQLAGYDGTPGDTDEFFNVAFNSIDPDTEEVTSDGIFIGVESGYVKGEPGEKDYIKVAVGGWFSGIPTEGFTGVEEEEGLNAGDVSSSGPYGAYALAETSISETMGVFFKAGWADPAINRFSMFLAGGLNYTGLVPGRVDDVFGVAVTQTRQSQDFLTLNEGSDLVAAETTFEVTYSAQINEWLMVQPDLQFIQAPAMIGNTDIMQNATVFGLRLQATY